MNLAPDMLESQSRALKTRNFWPSFQKKIKPKISLIGLSSRVRQIAKNAKTCPYCDVTFRKPQTKKYFHPAVEDLLNP